MMQEDNIQNIFSSLVTRLKQEIAESVISQVEACFKKQLSALVTKTEFLTTEQVCKQYNISKSTVIKLRKDKKCPMPHYCIGDAIRFKKSEVDHYFSTFFGINIITNSNNKNNNL